MDENLSWLGKLLGTVQKYNVACTMVTNWSIGHDGREPQEHHFHHSDTTVTSHLLYCKAATRETVDPPMTSLASAVHLLVPLYLGRIHNIAHAEQETNICKVTTVHTYRFGKYCTCLH